MASILITGGAGFIGANFVRYRTASHPGDRLIVVREFKRGTGTSVVKYGAISISDGAAPR